MILVEFKFEGFLLGSNSWLVAVFFGVVCEKSSRLGSSNLECRKWSKMSNLKRGDFRKDMYNYVYIYIIIYSYSIYIFIFIIFQPLWFQRYIYNFKKFSHYSRIFQETPWLCKTQTTSLPRRCSSRWATFFFAMKGVYQKGNSNRVRVGKFVVFTASRRPA